MMRSLFSAVSGLKTHQTRMDVIGNNISNVNTEAFKSSQVRFSDIMYQNSSSASGGDVARGIGGVNAKQIGLGVSMASTMCNITGAGAAETTGNPFDLRLSDSQTTNFFIVSDGKNQLFTRAGSFYVDGNGYLCMSSTGYIVQGWQVDPTSGDIRKDLVSPLQVMAPENLTAPPEATTEAYVSGILDKTDPNIEADGGYIMTLGFFDDLGYNYTAKFSVLPSPSTPPIDGQYYVQLTNILDTEGKELLPYDGNGTLTPAVTAADLFGDGSIPDGGYLVQYDQNNGKFVSIDPPTGGLQAGGTGTLTGDSFKYLSLSKLTTMMPLGQVESNFQDIRVDFSRSLNQYNNGVSSYKALKGAAADGDGAGKRVGKMTGLQVDQQGQIYGNYDNGNTILLGQIAVAQFANASGLEKVGDNCYQTTLNSGEFDGIGVEVSVDGSKINSGQLEMSNVDLSGQFTDMIVTQRGFQANSRVITVSDTLLEELINLKR